MKKLIAILTLLVLATTLCLALVACDNGGTRDIPGWDDTKQNVVFYTWGSAEENALLQDVIDKFHAIPDNKDINVVIQKAGNDYYGDLEYKLAGKQSPDIVLMKPGYIQPYLEAGAIISLQDYIDNSSVITSDMIWGVNDGYRYNAETLETGNASDDVYSLIKDFSPDFVMNYNKQLVNDTVANNSYPKQGDTNYPSMTTPMTYRQYIDFAYSMQSGTTLMGSALDNEPYQQLLEWIQQAGGSLYSADHKTVNDIANTPALRGAFDYYRMLRDQCSNNPIFDQDTLTFASNATKPAITAPESVQLGAGQLKQRQTASIFYGRWALTAYEMNSPACAVGYAPPPVPNGMEIAEDTKYAGITAMVGMSISAKSQQKDASFKFIEYYFTEGLQELARMGYNIPGNKKIAETTFLNDPTLTEDEKLFNEFFYDLALNNSFVIEYNRYMSQSIVEKSVLAPLLTQYFADSKGKPYNNELWETTLDNITEKLQDQLDKLVP